MHKEACTRGGRGRVLQGVSGAEDLLHESDAFWIRACMRRPACAFPAGSGFVRASTSPPAAACDLEERGQYMMVVKADALVET